MDGKRLLVTGASGFIGSELMMKLEQLNKYEIHTLDMTEAKTNGKATHHKIDLTDYDAVKMLVGQLKPDYVINLAARSSPSDSFEHYIESLEANLMSTVNLAEICRKEVPNLIQFITPSTTEVYGNTLTDMKSKLNENSPMHPGSTYAVSRVAIDYYMNYMGSAYDFPFTILRFTNTYGRKDNNTYFIERTITQMLADDDVQLGNPSAVRDWLYVDDHVDAYIKALENPNAMKQTMLICTGEGHTTEETAALIAKMTGFKGQIQWNAIPKRPLDAHYVIGDNSLAKKLLGWEPKHTLEQGLKITIDHYRK